MRRPEPSATRSPCQSPQHWDLGGPGGSRVVTFGIAAATGPTLFARFSRLPARVTVCTSRRPERQIHTPAPDPVAPVRPDTTSQQHMHTVANCTPIPPRFTPHQKCWTVKITRFSPKVAPHSRMTAQSGDWCRFELSSGRQRADAHARSQSTHIAHESQALPSLLDAPPSARPASVCHTCLCSAHGRCCLPFACPLGWRALPACSPPAHLTDAPAHSLDPQGAPTPHSRSAGDVVH